MTSAFSLVSSSMIGVMNQQHGAMTSGDQGSLSYPLAGKSFHLTLQFEKFHFPNL